jgi:hypothetical protein
MDVLLNRFSMSLFRVTIPIIHCATGLDAQFVVNSSASGYCTHVTSQVNRGIVPTLRLK